MRGLRWAEGREIGRGEKGEGIEKGWERSGALRGVVGILGVGGWKLVGRVEIRRGRIDRTGAGSVGFKLR